MHGRASERLRWGGKGDKVGAKRRISRKELFAATSTLPPLTLPALTVRYFCIFLAHSLSPCLCLSLSLSLSLSPSPSPSLTQSITRSRYLSRAFCHSLPPSLCMRWDLKENFEREVNQVVRREAERIYVERIERLFPARVNRI